MTAKVNLSEVWVNGIEDTINKYQDNLNFDGMAQEDFIAECIDLIGYYFENEMIGLEVNYYNIVVEVAKSYDIWED